MGTPIRFEVGKNNDISYIYDTDGHEKRVETSIRLQDFIGAHSARKLLLNFSDNNELIGIDLFL
ncbi:hypothetical protein KKF84_01120 [Myxococcota bacterium]|nr:hypothetical protein [Myxococcota bacterium]MBU1533884.1 hypothetical protein [Myxococcota bacterium]